SFGAIAELGPRFVPGDEPVSDVVEVVADSLWLRTNSQDIVADTLDQRRLPARRDGAESVPGVAGDKTKLGGRNSKLLLDISVSLAGGLMVHHTVCAEPSLEEIDNTAVLELTGLDLEQIVGEREEPETRSAQLAERRRNLGIGRHHGKLFRELFL